MSRNTTAENLNWYELGLRISQARQTCSYHADENTADNPLLPAVLDHLLTALLRVSFSEQEREVVDIDDCRNRLLAVRNVADAERQLQQMRVLLDGATSRLQHRTESLEPPTHVWFQLGAALIDGLEEDCPEGRLYIQEPATPATGLTPENAHLAYSQLASTPPPPPCWEWNNDDRIQSLLAQLPIERSTVFPPLNECVDAEWSSAMQLLCDEFCGWEILEYGLRQMRAAIQTTCTAVPRWDPQERILWVGDRIARRYTRRAPVQFEVLTAFESNEWSSSIDNPLSHRNRMDDTIRSLNNGLDQSLIRFHWSGTGQVCWAYGEEFTANSTGGIGDE